MKEKLKLPIIILLFILILIGVPVVLIMKNKKTATLTPLGSGQKNIISTEKTVAYRDSSGFKFDYPQDLTVKDVSGDAPSVYSFLEISSGKQESKMTIKVIDSLYDSLSAYFLSKEASGAGVNREVMISSMPAKQVQFANPKRLATIAIAEGVMYLIENPLDDSGYWNKVHNQIISSFTVETQKTSTVNSDSRSDQSTSDEEVIE